MASNFSRPKISSSAISPMEGADHRIRRWLYWLLGIKFVVLFIRSFLPFVLPHVWRQVDTLAVSLRYWMRWTQEPFSWSHLLPAYLNNGMGYGFGPMEFPLLNWFLALGFAAPMGWGRILATWIYLIIVAFLTYANIRVWKQKTILGINAELVMLTLPLIGIASTYVGRVMPDYLAALLIIIGLGLRWPLGPALGGIVLIALGVLVKPTAVAALGLLLVLPWRSWMKMVPVLILTLVPAGLFYTLGTKFLLSLAQGYIPFETGIASTVTQNFSVFFSDGKDLIDLLWKKIAFILGLPVMIVSFLISSRKDRVYWLLFGVLLLQILFAVVLRGFKLHDHYYNMLPTSIAIALIAVYVLQNSKVIHLKRFLIFAFLLTYLEAQKTEFDVLFGEEYIKTANSFKECRELKSELKDLPWDSSYIFRTKFEFYPALGFCFEERVYSQNAKYALAYSQDPIGSGCKVLAEKSVVRVEECSYE